MGYRMLTLIKTSPSLFCEGCRPCFRLLDPKGGETQGPFFGSGVEELLIVDGDFPVAFLFPESLAPPVR